MISLPRRLPRATEPLLALVPKLKLLSFISCAALRIICSAMVSRARAAPYFFFLIAPDSDTVIEGRHDPGSGSFPNFLPRNRPGGPGARYSQKECWEAFR